MGQRSCLVHGQEERLLWEVEPLLHGSGTLSLTQWEAERVALLDVEELAGLSLVEVAIFVQFVLAPRQRTGAGSARFVAAVVQERVPELRQVPFALLLHDRAMVHA